MARRRVRDKACPAGEIPQTLEAVKKIGWSVGQGYLQRFTNAVIPRPLHLGTIFPHLSGYGRGKRGMRQDEFFLTQQKGGSCYGTES
jgi:hypothetical protein